MNLHGIVAGAIGVVNPQIPVALQVNTGSTTAPNGTQTPTYAPPINVMAQVQPVTWKDLQQLEALNIQGIRWKAYLYGQVDGVVRAERKGGDLITIATGRHQGVWLVAQVLEQFPDWVACAITLQNGA